MLEYESICVWICENILEYMRTCENIWREVEFTFLGEQRPNSSTVHCVASHCALKLNDNICTSKVSGAARYNFHEQLQVSSQNDKLSRMNLPASALVEITVARPRNVGNATRHGLRHSLVSLSSYYFLISCQISAIIGHSIRSQGRRINYNKVYKY